MTTTLLQGAICIQLYHFKEGITMWIKERKNGKFLYREEYTNKFTGKRATVSVTLNSKSKQAQNKAWRILRQKIADKNQETTMNKNVTFKEVASEWLKIKSMEDNLKPATISAYEHRIRTLTNIVGDYLLEQITPEIMNRAFKSMLIDENLAYKTVSERMKLFKKIVPFAVYYGYLNEDKITPYLTLPKINTSKPNAQEEKFLEKEEAEYIFAELIKGGYEIYADMLKLQMQTGMRFGEVCALRVSQIDLNERTIDINQQYDRANKVFTLPKGGYTRLININQETVQLLNRVLQRRKVLLMAYGVRDIDLIFFGKNGQPIDISHVNMVLKYFEKDYLTTHIFRHTFVTRMVENYTPPKLIAQHIGHKGTELIDRVYSHFSKKMNEDLKQVIDEIQM